MSGLQMTMIWSSLSFSNCGTGSDPLVLPHPCSFPLAVSHTCAVPSSWPVTSRPPLPKHTLTTLLSPECRSSAVGVRITLLPISVILQTVTTRELGIDCELVWDGFGRDPGETGSLRRDPMTAT